MGGLERWGQKVARAWSPVLSPGLLTVSTRCRRGAQGPRRWWRPQRMRPEPLVAARSPALSWSTLDRNLGEKYSYWTVPPRHRARLVEQLQHSWRIHSLLYWETLTCLHTTDCYFSWVPSGTFTCPNSGCTPMLTGPLAQISTHLSRSHGFPFRNLLWKGRGFGSSSSCLPFETTRTRSWNKEFDCSPSRKFLLNAEFIVALFPTEFRWWHS